MRVDLHNHTTRCNHAEGTMESYVEAAIAAHTEIFGFADHAPMDFDPAYRMAFEAMGAYEAEVAYLREKYADKITLLLGYEVDYLKGHMDARVLEADVDYLIGSVHFLDEWGFDNPEFIGKYENADIDAIWQKYFDAIEMMAKSGYFQIVGHLDLIKVFKFLPKNDICSIAHNALLAIKESNMTLELNVAGYRKPIGEPYPSLALLQKAHAMGISITFASDAHKPQQVGLFSSDIIAFAKSAGYSHADYYKHKERFSIPF